MPTHETDARGVGPAVREVAEHASALGRLELELAALELKRKAASLAVGIALALAAAVFGLFALGFALAAAAAALATVLATWLSLLIVCGGLAFLALVLGLVALSGIRRGAPPVPEQAIEEAKETAAVLGSNGG
ncbi:MAG: phage holin family protein [Actinomycetota bacterium]|nr:phage holin family protein [Actinomycetota bacterium]